MKEGQESIYYACGDNLARIETMPQIELLKDKGLEVLYLTDDVDEFVLKQFPIMKINLLKIFRLMI